MDQLKAINTFIHSAELQSFSKAAHELGISPQAASKHVIQLEEFTGVRLFNRTTHRISLTEEGRKFFEKCKLGLGAINEGLRELKAVKQEAMGKVRLASPYLFSRSYIAPLLAKFADKYPDISLDIVIDDHFTDIVEKEIDVGIRVGKLAASTLIAREIASVQLVICASYEYIERYGEPGSIEDLERHRCINLLNVINGKERPWVFVIDGEPIERHINSIVCVNDPDTQLQAVLHGAGVAQLATLAAAPYLRERKIKHLLTDQVATGNSVYVITQHRKGLPQKSRVLVDFLTEELRQHPDMQPLKFNKSGKND